MTSPWEHEPREGLTDQHCMAHGCLRNARCSSAIGPLCGLHYQRFAKYGSADLPKRQRAVFTCKVCGSPIENNYGRVRAKKRGYGYCSYECNAKAKTETAADDAAMRFMNRVNFGQDDECWTFKGRKSNKGYATFDWRAPGAKRTVGHPASRMMWLIVSGPIPEDKEVCHSCDNPACVNPGHLWLGTHKENMQDMVNKGRANKRGLKGTEAPWAKLTEAQVIAIRGSSESNKALATKYGVTAALIWRIRNRRCWTHV